MSYLVVTGTGDNCVGYFVPVNRCWHLVDLRTCGRFGVDIARNKAAIDVYAPSRAEDTLRYAKEALDGDTRLADLKDVRIEWVHSVAVTATPKFRVRRSWGGKCILRVFDCDLDDDIWGWRDADYYNDAPELLTREGGGRI